MPTSAKTTLKHNSLVTGKLLLLFLAVVEAFLATSKLDIHVFDHLDKIWSTIPPILPLVATERGHFGGKKPKIGDFLKKGDVLKLSKCNYVVKCLFRGVQLSHCRTSVRQCPQNV